MRHPQDGTCDKILGHILWHLIQKGQTIHKIIEFIIRRGASNGAFMRSWIELQGVNDWKRYNLYKQPRYSQSWRYFAIFVENFINVECSTNHVIDENFLHAVACLETILEALRRFGFTVSKNIAKMLCIGCKAHIDNTDIAPGKSTYKIILSAARIHSAPASKRSNRTRKIASFRRGTIFNWT